MEEGAVGEEMDWVQFRRVGSELTGRKVAVVSVSLSRRWSKDEMRAIVLHEMGHALGIQGAQRFQGRHHVFPGAGKEPPGVRSRHSVPVCLEDPGKQTQPAGP